MIHKKRRTINKVPSMKQRISNLTTELNNWRQQGYEIVPKERFDRRMEKCQSCEYFKKLAMGGLCLKCGCYSIKLWLKTSKCPINKW